MIDWLRELMGMPAGTEGVLVSGGSLANLTAFAAARAALGPGSWTCLTDQTHSSHRARPASRWASRPSRVRMLRERRACGCRSRARGRGVAADRAAGRRPMMVATAGTTNTGASTRCRRSPSCAGPRACGSMSTAPTARPQRCASAGRAALAGIERADSLVLDPHKWLFQPYDVGCVLVRRPGALERAFR